MAVSTQAAMMMHRTKPSPNIRVASRNAVRLYRESLRTIPVIREKYQVDYPKEQIAKRFREEFERNRGLKDPKMVDVLVFKGYSELDEAKFLWKQRPHIMAFLAPTNYSNPKSANEEFLRKFFTGQEIDY